MRAVTLPERELLRSLQSVTERGESPKPPHREFYCCRVGPLQPPHACSPSSARESSWRRVRFLAGGGRPKESLPFHATAPCVVLCLCCDYITEHAIHGRIVSGPFRERCRSPRHSVTICDFCRMVVYAEQKTSAECSSCEATVQIDGRRVRDKLPSVTTMCRCNALI